MNITIYTSYHEATTDADEFAHETGLDHHVIERFPAGPVLGDLDSLLGADIAQAEHRYTVLSEPEWAAVAADWDAEAQYTAPGQVTE